MPRSASRRRICRNSSKRPSGRFFIGLLGLLTFGVPGGPAYGQKQVSRVLLDPDVSSIVVDAGQSFALDLETGPSDQVTVEARMEGEYQGEVLVQTEQLGRTLRIGTGYSPAFDLPNDKLGAHKVLSVRLRVIFPENQQVEVYGGQCQVAASGVYRVLNIHIEDGGCRLDHRAGATRVETRSAPITARVSTGTIEASSRYGEVRIDPIPKGEPRYFFQSTRGDIRVIRRP